MPYNTMMAEILEDKANYLECLFDDYHPMMNVDTAEVLAKTIR